MLTCIVCSRIRFHIGITSLCTNKQNEMVSSLAIFLFNSLKVPVLTLTLRHVEKNLQNTIGSVLFVRLRPRSTENGVMITVFETEYIAQRDNVRSS